MKHTYIIFCLSLLLLSLAGCKQDELQSSHQSDTRLTSVKATTSAAVKSRTQLSGNAVIWEHFGGCEKPYPIVGQCCDMGTIGRNRYFQ